MPAYEDAIRAYMAGHKTEAQTLLGKALRANPRDQASWLLLAQCVDVVERKKYCLQQVLLINPKNPEALERLAELQKRPTPPFQTAALQAELNSIESKESAPGSEPALASTPEPTSEFAPTSEPELTSEPAVFAAPATASSSESTSAPMAAEPVVEEPQKPITRPYMSALSAESFVDKPKKTSTRPLLPSLTTDEPVTEEEPRKPSTRPFAIPLETTDEPKRPITRPLAAPPEPPAEPKKPATQPLPPPPPALQEIINARASGGANDETLIASKGASSDFQPLEADEAFAPLPDSLPPVSGFGAIIMDDDSFRPGPFSEAEQEPAEVDSFESPSAEPDPDLQDPVPDPEPESDLPATDDVTLVGVSAPAIPDFTPGVVPPPIPTKPSFRARLEEAVAVLEKDDKLEGVRLLESLLHDNPRNEMAWMWLGAASNDVNRQRECYLRALEVNPRSRMARLKLAEAEERLTAAGVALLPLDHPLPPDPTQPAEPASNSNSGLWIGIGLVVVALILIIGFVVYWVVTHR
jgi:hypothetical protein